MGLIQFIKNVRCSALSFKGNKCKHFVGSKQTGGSEEKPDVDVNVVASNYEKEND